jgi:RimJ/RimL family protein N-acetyltransferase
VADPRWLVNGPPDQVEVDSVELLLRRARPSDAAALITAINASLDHLRPWMPWAGRPATEDSIGTFLAESTAKWEARQEFIYLIREPEGSEVLGCIGLHNRLGRGALEIGYWVHVDHAGSGVATASTSALISAAFSLGPVEAVEIHCDATNRPSAAVPRKLGFRLHRTETRPPTAPGGTENQLVWVLRRPSVNPDGRASGPQAT